MLIRFRVSDYRGFKDPIEIDFTDKKNYQFGKDCVRGDFLDKIVIVGVNGAGKTNFGYALMDLVGTLTGFSRDIGQCERFCFVNGDSDAEYATFHYEFAFGGDYVVYEYGKSSPEEVVCEKLVINRQRIFEYTVDDIEHGFFDLDKVHASKIDVYTLDGKKVLLRRILEETYQDKYSILRAISDSTNHALYYRAMWKKDEHIGLIDGDDDIDHFILNNGYISELSEFLREVGVEDLNIGGSDGKLVIRTKNKELPFFVAASRGTMILTRLYCWIKRCTDKESMIYFDDFDDMFYFIPAEKAMRKIITSHNAQCVFVTHDTGLISNDLVRPDCCFIMEKGTLSSLSSRTGKDIRKGHNLEKMLRDGEFDSKLVE